MVSLKSVERQLKQIGCNYKFWGRPEIVELSKILMPDEKIAQCVNGLYEGGFALLCATDQRLLLVDKKPMYLTIEDIRFDMVSDLNYNHRLLDASIQIMTGVKTLHFRAYNQHRLRLIMTHVQQRVTEIRHRKSDAERAEQKIAEELEAAEKYSSNPMPTMQQFMHTQSASHQPAPAMQAMATANMPATDGFNGFRRHVALQIAHYIGPRAVAFSQMPPTLSRYKLPLPRRPFRNTT